MSQWVRMVGVSFVSVALLIVAGCADDTDGPGNTTSSGSGGQAAAGGGGAGPGGAHVGGGSGLGGGGAGHEPMAMGPQVTVGDGTDPDLAVDSQGRLHVAYVRGGRTYYRTVDLPSSLGSEIDVGQGEDPQIVVDSLDAPHVVYGALTYSRWAGSGFAAPLALDVAWRKPRLAIDGQDRIYATVDQDQPRESRLHVVDAGVIIAAGVNLGDDNGGGIDVDSAGVAHFSWRGAGSCASGQAVHHNTYESSAGAGTSECLHGSSDFSWLAVDRRDDSVHLVNTVPWAQGLNYLVRRNGVWGDPQVVALAETQAEPEPDNVGPTIGVDVLGNSYIAFSGAEQIPYVLMIDEAGTASSVVELDPEHHTTAGGKYENPNVGCHEQRAGACVAWHDEPSSVVYLRCLGMN